MSPPLLTRETKLQYLGEVEIIVVVVVVVGFAKLWPFHYSHVSLFFLQPESYLLNIETDRRSGGRRQLTRPVWWPGKGVAWVIRVFSVSR